MDLDKEVAFARKLIEMGEPDRAISLCEYLKHQCNNREDLVSLIEIRETIIVAIRASSNCDMASINHQYDKIFENQLSLGKKAAAARCLYEKAIHNEGSDIFWVMLEKIISLFSPNTDPEILKVVGEAYMAMLVACPSEDEAVLNLSKRYLKFLTRPEFSVSAAEDFLLEIYEWGGMHIAGQPYVDMVEEFMRVKNAQTEELRSLLARGYGEAGNYDKAIQLTFALLLDCDGSERSSYLSWIGGWFEEINQSENAIMFYKGCLDAKRFLGDDGLRSQIEEKIHILTFTEEVVSST